MVCIYCGHKTRVSNSRTIKQHLSTWRRRECPECKGVFTTRENIDTESALRIKNEAGALQPFQRDKLLLSIHRSLSHRKTAVTDATQLTDTAITGLATEHSGGIIEIAHLKDVVRDVLQRFDPAAGVHYAAHHQSN